MENDRNPRLLHISSGLIMRSKVKELKKALTGVIQELRIEDEAQKVLLKEPSHNIPNQ